MADSVLRLCTNHGIQSTLQWLVLCSAVAAVGTSALGRLVPLGHIPCVIGSFGTCNTNALIVLDIFRDRAAGKFFSTSDTTCTVVLARLYRHWAKQIWAGWPCARPVLQPSNSSCRMSIIVIFTAFYKAAMSGLLASLLFCIVICTHSSFLLRSSPFGLQVWVYTSVFFVTVRAPVNVPAGSFIRLRPGK